MLKLKKLLSVAVSITALLSSLSLPAYAEGEAEEVTPVSYKQTIFSYDSSRDGATYDSNTLKARYNDSISSSESGIAITSPNDGKAWSSVALSDLGTNSIRLQATIDASDTSAFKNILFGLTNGDHYRIDQHVNENNGTMLHIMSNWPRKLSLWATPVAWGS